VVGEENRLVSHIVGALKFSRVEIGGLAKLRLLALRRHVWFRVLSRIERGLLDLTLKVARKVRSRVLYNAICSIVNKLAEALESRAARVMREVGFKLAERISQIAQSWGNMCAREWAYDVGFAKYLAIMEMNAKGFVG